MVAVAVSHTPRWSPRSRTGGKSNSTAPTDSSGLCLWRRQRSRSGTHSGPHENLNGHKMEVAMKLSVFRKPMLAMFLFTVAMLCVPHDARAFCGFYVGKAD